MLFIFNAIIYSVWLFWVISKGKYSWHVIINAYFIFLLTIDGTEAILSSGFGLYSLPMHLFSDPIKDEISGFILSDGIILPFISFILCHYVMQSKKYWRVLFIFILLQIILEWVFFSSGYLIYHKWNIGLSFILYSIGSYIAAKYASSLMRYNPPILYSVRLAAAIYAAVEWLVAVLSGLFGLFQWKPELFPQLYQKQPLPFMAIACLLALFAAAIAPKILSQYRPMVFLTLAALATLFFYFAYEQGWLIYYHWNHFLTALRLFVSFIIIIWYDRWESPH
jgi:hypothetical protein